MNNKDDQRVIIITGSNQGIGREIAELFSRNGWKVVVSGRDLPSCESVASSINQENSSALALKCDVRSESDVINLFANVIKKWGRIDAVVSNAGITGGSDLLIDYSLEKWNNLVETHLTGSFLIGRQSIRTMKSHPIADGLTRNIIFISSLAAVKPFSNKVAYSAVKGGMLALANALTEEVRHENIHVSTICPGSVATNTLTQSGDQPKHPMSPQTIAEAVYYLTSIQDNALIRQMIIERREEI